jgi:hypothetical protein
MIEERYPRLVTENLILQVMKLHLMQADTKTGLAPNSRPQLMSLSAAFWGGRSFVFIRSAMMAMTLSLIPETRSWPSWCFNDLSRASEKNVKLYSFPNKGEKERTVRNRKTHQRYRGPGSGNQQHMIKPGLGTHLQRHFLGYPSQASGRPGK